MTDQSDTFYSQEDAATAEIARCQLWQWVHHSAKLDDGKQITSGLVSDVLAQEAQKLVASSPGISVENVEIAKTYLVGEINAKFPSEFLTSYVPLPLVLVHRGTDFLTSLFFAQ